jgi:uncharacterized repeat protein (TIGR04052 family)
MNFRHLGILLSACFIAACGADDEGDGDAPRPLALKFNAVYDGAAVGCTSSLTGLGSNGTVSVGISDLRFYVTNLKLFDRDGAELETTLDANEFQYKSSAGSVALVDLTGNTEGSCAAFDDGTARTNPQITGTVKGAARRVTFDIGIPAPLVKEVILTKTAEDAPSPLAEMHWSWAFGYRYFVFNFTVANGAETGDGNLHIGSRDCGGDGAKALTDRDACGVPNIASVALDDFDPDAKSVAVDLGMALEGLDFVAPIFSDEPPYDPIGEGPGVSCHSSPMQDDCMASFGNFGLDVVSGAATSANNRVFRP